QAHRGVRSRGVGRRRAFCPGQPLPGARRGYQVRLRIGRGPHMPREMMYAEAMASAITEEMQRDSEVMFYGQNLGMTDRDPLVRMFGKNRVRITPISETAEMGIAVGAALTGLRPVVELWMSEFMLVAMGQLLNEAPRLRYMSGGQ